MRDWPAPSIFGPLMDGPVGLHGGPIDIPLDLQIPALHINAPIVGVGITVGNVMDAPKGPAEEPIWKKVFWYRGSGVPGDSGIATVAGHFNGREGIPAVFADLGKLREGDAIIVRHIGTGEEVIFVVTEVKTYGAAQVGEKAVLERIYGSGPVEGRGPDPAQDGLSHLTLITCAGDYVNGSFDHRLVVYVTAYALKP